VSKSALVEVALDRLRQEVKDAEALAGVLQAVLRLGR